MDPVQNSRKKLMLESCTKERCARCDMGYILKDYVKPIMQLLTIDIKDYYMRLLTSKCLNTSVLIAFFMAGKRKGLKMANYCDSNETTKRHESTDPAYKDYNNPTLIEKLYKDLMHKNVKYRYLYYIMMTDSYLPMKNGSPEKKFFCGHVFVIEKIPGENGGLPFYYFYQSYINEYDFKGHVERNNNSLKLDYKKMNEMILKIKYILLNNQWDSTSVKYWKDITFVDTKQLLGSQPAEKIHLCYTKTKLKHCIENVSAYIKEKLSDISKLKIEDMNKIYGDTSLFDSDQQPLTAYKIKTSLEKLQNQIIEHKTILQ